jgi:hypothetical protein
MNIGSFQLWTVDRGSKGKGKVIHVRKVTIHLWTMYYILFYLFILFLYAVCAVFVSPITKDVQNVLYEHSGMPVLV